MVLNPCDNLCMVFDTKEFEESIPPPILSKGMVKQFCESDLENTWWAVRFSKQSIQVHNWDTQFRVSVSSGKWCILKNLIFCRVPLAAKLLVASGFDKQTLLPCHHQLRASELQQSLYSEKLCLRIREKTTCVLEPRLQNIPWNNAFRKHSWLGGVGTSLQGGLWNAGNNGPGS